MNEKFDNISNASLNQNKCKVIITNNHTPTIQLPIKDNKNIKQFQYTIKTIKSI